MCSTILWQSFSAFFEGIYSSCCCGYDKLVPILCHDILKCEWNATARTTYYVTKLKYLLMRLSQTFNKTAISDKDSIIDSELLLSFLKVISRNEKQIFEERDASSAYGNYTKSQDT